MFTLRKKHFEIRSRLSPLARLIHELLMSDERYHEPRFFPLSSALIEKSLEDRYGYDVSPDRVDTALQELYFTDLIKTKPGVASIAHFRDHESDSLEKLCKEIWDKVDPEASRRRIEALVHEVGPDEIWRQVKWFSHRNYTWTKQPYFALVSYCRDRLPEPKALTEKREQETQKNIVEESRKRYDNYVREVVRKANFNDNEKQEIYQEAKKMLGDLRLGENCMQSLTTYLAGVRAGAIPYEEWMINEKKNQ